jgi:hypothetical protein
MVHLLFVGARQLEGLLVLRINVHIQLFRPYAADRINQSKPTPRFRQILAVKDLRKNLYKGTKDGRNEDINIFVSWFLCFFVINYE